MGEESETHEKENTFGNSHTFRPPHNPLRSIQLSINRPETKEGDIITTYYSEIDNILREHGLLTDAICSYSRSWKKHDWIDLRIPHEEFIELLEAASVRKSSKYDNWANLNSVTYSVPSNCEVIRVHEDNSAFKQRFSLIDGKLYDRDMIYRYNALTHSWVPICSNKIFMPIFRTSNSRVDKNIVSLKILSVSNALKPHKTSTGSGVIHHDCPWHYGHSRPVAGDVFIDLGSPQTVTHIGTVGSFIPTELYPPPQPYHNSGTGGRWRRKRYRRKYNQGIFVEEDQSKQSWCVSYRLMARKDAAAPWMYVGYYTANQNAYELVVNDVTSALLGVPVRYLMLKPVSNLHKHDYQQLTPCRMSVAVYGKQIEVKPKPMTQKDGEEVSNVELIEYTLTIPPSKQVRVKQYQHSFHWEYDRGTKWSKKKVWWDEIRDERREEDRHTSGDVESEDELISCEYEGLTESEEEEEECECDPNTNREFDATRLGDETDWPSLPSNSSSLKSGFCDMMFRDSMSSEDTSDCCHSSTASQESEWEIV